MTSRKMLATLVAAGALFALPTASQAGGLKEMHDCLFGWTAHFHHQDAAVKGKVLQLNLGYSHDINHAIPEGIKVTVEP